ncbi:LCP family protein [Robertmurraya sp. DFI.2.37]|uniref:LCP family protein n=1 Tax=Robertmurraya sp. DFI.2.37 TaxID=3031819 RepID=UPI001247FF96|nr:LCP family protein [Robertmurraya sp. DFI.2.37]MDF1507372.1 LCP family protein [Robertmurraya sp. DFI.2.37]
MRYEKQRRKKKRKWKVVLLLLFLSIAALLGYSYFQYQQGLSKSLEKAEGNSILQKDYEFNGKKDRYGGINILLLGSDSRGEEKARTDTIMIARYHPEEGTYKLISVMRDSYVDIPGYQKSRINTAFARGGPELLRETLKENFDIDIQYYAIIDFEGFVQLIDEAFPNGVEVDVEKKMSYRIGVTLEPGLQRLDGEHLLGYVRFRHDAVGDFGRVERQQKVVKEIGSQLTNIQTIAKLPKLIGVVTPFINTNMDTGDMLYIGKDFLAKENRNIASLRVPVDGAWSDARINGAEVLELDIEKNREAIHEFLAN